MWGTLAAALAPGVYLVWVGGWAILALGLAAMLAAVTYTGGPWPYGHRGLGDPAVFLFFGLAAVAGTYYVQAGRWSLESVWLGAGPGALATAILAVNNLRDIETDARAGKRTLAVMLGPSGTRVEYLLLCGLAAAVPPAGVVLFGWTSWTLLSLAGLLLLGRPLRTVLGGAAGQGDAELLDPALVDTARTLGAYGALAGLGFLL
jgi:1,4-dihydroxy-2-naphthoate octaprenyltransferase